MDIKTKNIKDLKNDLLQLYKDLREGKIDVNRANAMNNTASKIIATANVQINYYRLKKEIPSLEFLTEE